MVFTKFSLPYIKTPDSPSNAKAAPVSFHARLGGIIRRPDHAFEAECDFLSSGVCLTSYMLSTYSIAQVPHPRLRVFYPGDASLTFWK
jgi:hypothetical protein